MLLLLPPKIDVAFVPDTNADVDEDGPNAAAADDEEKGIPPKVVPDTNAVDEDGPNADDDDDDDDEEKGIPPKMDAPDAGTDGNLNPSLLDTPTGCVCWNGLGRSEHVLASLKFGLSLEQAKAEAELMLKVVPVIPESSLEQ